MAYEHHVHAGNTGDVFKHVALLALAAALKKSQLTVVESHGGSGSYTFQSTGEWQQGVGRLLAEWPAGASSGSVAVDRYLARVRRLQGDRDRFYPGSPLLLADALGPTGRIWAWEIDAAVAGRLRSTLAPYRGQVTAGDGLAALAALPAGEQRLVHVDPPYADKAEWTDGAAAVIASARAHRDAVYALWYPIKRLARPVALQQEFQSSKLPFVAIDLITTPLDTAPDKMAGSGILIVRPPSSAVADIAAAATVLGPVLATHGAAWSVRVTSG
jgi:23S rRNA (adenine2030-N6)-methyltransferase